MSKAIDELFERVKAVEEQIESLRAERTALPDDAFEQRLANTERIADLEIELRSLRSQASTALAESADEPAE
jgi:hypothetical protein